MHNGYLVAFGDTDLNMFHHPTHKADNLPACLPHFMCAFNRETH